MGEHGTWRGSTLPNRDLSARPFLALLNFAGRAEA
jgi:hypothetical protein